MRSAGWRWLTSDVTIPLLSTAAVVGSACLWLEHAALPRILAIATSLCVAAAFSLFLMNLHRLRPEPKFEAAS